MNQKLFSFILFLLLLAGPGASYAQECTSSGDCDTGMLCENGVCKNILQAASSDGGTVYWVDSRAGNDSNPGTKERPFKTISRTTKSGVLKPGDWVIIRGGIYREEVRPRESGAVVGRDTLRVTWAAYPGEEVIISGSDVITTPWVRQSDGTWKQNWVWEALYNDPGVTAIERRELFVDNGKVLLPVSSRSRVKPGTYYIEGGEGRATPSAVYMRTHNNSDPNKRITEVGQRIQLFATHGEPDYKCGSNTGGYYRLIDLTFRHAPGHTQRAPVCPGRIGSHLIRVTSMENAGAGFRIVGSRHVVRGARALSNGRIGLNGSADYALVDGAELAYNNTRGHGAFWESGGGKWVRTTGATFRHLYSHDNEGPGFWLDIENVNNTIERSVFDNNLGMGISVELETRGTRIVNNVVSRTRFAEQNFEGNAVNVQLSYGNLVAFNTFILNDGKGVYTWNDSRDKSHAPTRARNNDIYNNLFVANGLSGDNNAKRQMQIVDLEEGRNTHTVFSNRINGNAYWPKNGRGGSVGFGSLYLIRHPNGSTSNFNATSLNQWRDNTPHDDDSFVINLSNAHVDNPSDYLKGWKLTSGSQMIGKAVPLPSKWAPVTVDVEGQPRPAKNKDIGADQFGTVADNTPPGSRPGGDDEPAEPEPEPGSRDSGSGSTPERSPSNVVFAINAGGQAFLSPSGIDYAADSGYKGGKVYRTSTSIAASDDDVLYTSERFGDFAYNLPVENGTYEVTLRFAEIYWNAHGKRIFDVAVEDRQVISDLDIYKAAGSRTAHDVVTRVNVSDGELNLVFTSDVDNAKLAAVHARRISVADEGQGVHYEVFEGTWKRIPDFDKLTALETGTASGFYFPASVPADRFGVRFTGYLYAPTGGTYTFYTQSDDGSRLSINGRTVVNNDGRHGVVEQSGQIVLDAGLHAITVEYFENAGGEHLVVDWSGPNLSRGPIAPKSLYLDAPIAGESKANAVKLQPVSESTTVATYELAGNYPNPAAEMTTIEFSLPETSPVTLEVYNVLGQRVGTLADKVMTAGRHKINVDVTEWASGVYFYQLRAGNFVARRKLTVVR